jgi:Protein of unknown function (DUF3231)
MEDTTKIPLISSEITGLWNSYMGDTMIVCLLKHFLNRVDDSATRAILQQTSDLSTQHIQEVAEILKQEKLPIPHGFDDNDVNVDAPRMFTDAFYLNFLGFMARVGMHNYTLILNQLARSDMRAFFSKRITEYIDLFNNSADLRISKGIAVKAPRVEVPKEVQYIKSQSFITDWVGEKRPLLTIEITHIFGLVFANLLGRAISTAFGQSSKDKKISDFFFEGKELSTKLISELSELLTAEGIPIPSSSDSFVTDSTVAPFSDKLMLAHSALLASSATASLGMAMADTMRSDLEAKYVKYVAIVMNHGKKGANIMIDNGWLQQPPQAIKHENLVSV